MSVLSVSKRSFSDEVLSSSLPVLIDFWAPWCGPCRMLSPIVDEVAKDHRADLKVVKVNIDEEPELAGEFGVMSIPTLVLMKNGKIAASAVGVRPKQQIEAMLRE
ncbi:MAG: thioredoxin [Acutalibacteraceae bacterium]|nr:thioredoxin [Clostridiales bacterium]